MELNLAGRWAAITGGSQGIGRAVADELAAEGCNIRIAARTEADLREAADDIAARHGVEVAIHPGDLTDGEFVAALGRDWRDVDILVNNAGSVPRGSLVEVDDERWRKGWELKVFAYINLTRLIYPAMCARGSGVIVNVIGVGGERADANYIAGSTGNAALMMFTRSLGGDSIRHGVRVVGVNPGPVETEKYIGDAERLAAERLGDKDRWRELMAALPMGRPAVVEEISGLVALLASDRSAYTSGVIMTIDGGLLSDAAMGVKRR
jgi:NAD(P)-dependent dehydrogenase (short-subunit alcohol dehydrogenase family)